ncbi:MAG: hypothetical protein WBC93_01545 [Sulfitobacter sp.]
MEAIFSKEIQAGLNAARIAGMRKSSRLRLMVDDKIHPVLRMWKTGFALDAEDAPHLRGLVDLYDGANHLFECLIVASDEDDGEMQYEFKRATPIADRPALDFELSEKAPTALLTHNR